MLVYTFKEFAEELHTTKENIYLLETLGEIRSITIGSKKISVYEAERFLKENAGRDFSQILKDEKKRKKLAKLNHNVVEMKKEA